MSNVNIDMPAELQNPKRFKFYFLDKEDGKSIAVEKESDHGYNGLSFIQERLGFNVCPIYIARTFVSQQPDRYDYTTDFNEALTFSLMESKIISNNY